MPNRLHGVTYSSMVIDEAANLNFDRLEKIYEPCRVCVHPWYFHTNPAGCTDYSMPTVPVSPACACKKFVPSDNLAYIEYLYDAKGEIDAH